jgi:uncharacterized protein
MRLSFRDLRKAKQPISLHETVSLPQIAEETDQVMDVRPVVCDLVVEEVTEHLFRVHGTLNTDVTYQCSRCLEPFRRHLVATMEERFTVDVSSVDEDLHVIQDDEVDFDPYIEQAVNLELEFFPVCTGDCQGLCPTCGCNLNQQTCNCETKPVDPRLAVLQDLLSSDKSK